MKVRDLIDALTYADPDLEVIVMHGNQTVFYPVSVEADVDHNDKQMLITVSKSNLWQKQ